QWILILTLRKIMVFLLDVVGIGIMVWTSGSMVFDLYRHCQRLQYIHNTSLPPRTFLETRATQTILLSVSLFVSFYLLNSIFALYMDFSKSYLWLILTSTFLAACFPACSPFLLIASDSQVPRYCLHFWGRIKLST
uniref:Vomeronasal type-1 receptor n=1 Tax=Vombatus ursinus TaxID=29139 RepID=A0A4X2K9P0_VOMUR